MTTSDSTGGFTDPCVIVCAPDTFPRRREDWCPICRAMQRFAGYDQYWYGPTWTCLGCGDQWTDGELHPRPFKPRWRKENIARAEKVWDEAGQYTDEDRWAWMEREAAAHRAAAKGADRG